MLTDGPTLHVEMRRRIQQLPAALWYDRAYLREDFWHVFLAREHEARRVIHDAHDF
jgi:hypothetical protein